MMVTSAKIRENVQPVLDGCDNIVAAYLFGSVATGRQRPGSDIDIAVLLVEARHHDRKSANGHPELHRHGRSYRQRGGAGDCRPF